MDFDANLIQKIKEYGMELKEIENNPTLFKGDSRVELQGNREIYISNYCLKGFGKRTYEDISNLQEILQSDTILTLAREFAKGNPLQILGCYELNEVDAGINIGRRDCYAWCKLTLNRVCGLKENDIERISQNLDFLNEKCP